MVSRFLHFPALSPMYLRQGSYRCLLTTLCRCLPLPLQRLPGIQFCLRLVPAALCSFLGETLEDLLAHLLVLPAHLPGDLVISVYLEQRSGGPLKALTSLEASRGSSRLFANDFLPTELRD